MKRTKKNLISKTLIVFLILIVSLITTFVSYKFRQKSNFTHSRAENIDILKTSTNTITPTLIKDKSDLSVSTTPMPTYNPIPKDYKFNIGGWIPSFDFNDGITTLNNYKAQTSTIHYAGLSITGSGDLNFAKNFDKDLDRLNQTGVKFGINIISSDYDSTFNFLNDNNKKDAFKNLIYKLSNNYKNFNAVNIDFEQIRFTNRDLYINFLKELKIQTQENKLLLYVISYAKTRDFMGNNTLDSQDYEKISGIADYLVLMAYDYIHYVDQNEKYLQANSPDAWIDAVLNYAVSRADKNKIILALPLYGYAFDKTTGKKLSPYVYSQVQTIIKNENLIPHLNSDYGEMYIDRSNNMRIYFQDRNTLIMKKEIALKYGINNIFYWRLGNDLGIGY